jgi:hypothetical protein
MSRAHQRFHRLAAAILAILALGLPGHAEGKGGKKAASTAATSKKAASTPSKKDKAATPSKTAKREPSSAPKQTATEKSTSTDKRAPQAKQSSGAKRTPDPAAETKAAKAIGRTGEPTRTPGERALKPPGVARPMVRQVSSRLVVPPRDVAERTLAFRYANLGDAEVIAELERRGIAWTPASPPLPGVRTPIRLAGPLRGIRIHSTLPEPERKNSPFEILDARLALALDDFCALLARHDVVEIVHYTMYRPPGELPPDLYKQIRHPAGLAIDLGAVRKADGRWLAIGPHWPSDIGAKTCGEGAREHWSRAGREIVSIACEAADLGIFHFILTPHFDAAHADHLHLEIKPDTRWFLVN